MGVKKKGSAKTKLGKGTKEMPRPLVGISDETGNQKRGNKSITAGGGEKKKVIPSAKWERQEGKISPRKGFLSWSREGWVKGVDYP